MAFYDVGVNATENHFFCSLLVKAATVLSGPRGRDLQRDEEAEVTL